MTASEREVNFPDEIAIDPDKSTRAIFIHPDEGLYIPGTMVNSFKQVDQLYAINRKAFFHKMLLGVKEENGLATVLANTGQEAYPNDLLVVMSPLNDGKPESGSSEIAQFVEEEDSVSVRHAKPNSWRPLAKLFSDYYFGEFEGMGMPRLQVFAREAPAMTIEQRHRVAKGDMMPFGELAETAIKAADRLKHEVYGTGDYDRIHFFCAGMGAKALGAAVYMAERRQIGGVTLMNFSLGEQSIAKLARDYTGRRMVGEASKLILPKDYLRVPEFKVLTELDRRTEFAMRIRQIRAITNWRMLNAIMNATSGVEYIENLLEKGSTITIANGHNEAMVEQTDHYLPVGDGLLHRIDIVGIEGKKVGQLANEHGAALSVVSNQGLRNYLRPDFQPNRP